MDVGFETGGPCPVCGGHTREPLAPGFWRCTSLVNDVTTYVGPAPGYPPAMGVQAPRQHVVTRPCGNQYAEKTASSAGGGRCFCNTYSIGSCTDCHREVCGFHSSLDTGERVCSECATTRQSDRATREADEQHRREQAELARRAEELRVALDERLQRLRLIRPAALRFLATVDIYPHLRRTAEDRDTMLGSSDSSLATLHADVAGLFDGEPLPEWAHRVGDPHAWSYDLTGLVQWLAPQAGWGKPRRVKEVVRRRNDMTPKFGTTQAYMLGPATKKYTASDNDRSPGSTTTMVPLLMLNGHLAEAVQDFFVPKVFGYGDPIGYEFVRRYLNPGATPLFSHTNDLGPRRPS